MDIQTVATNVKAYRSEKSLTQKKLAELAGISTQAIKQLESENLAVSYGTLRRISAVLGVQLADLLRSPQTLRPVLFRSMKKLKNRSVILSVSGRWLDNYEFLEEELDCCQDFKLKNIVFDCSPEELAKRVRKQLRIPADSPIDDIGLLLDRIGVKLFLYNKTLSDGFFGLSILGKNQVPAIVINTSNLLSSERQIFSAAHELGHVLMHLDSFEQDEQNPQEELFEKDADSFAGYFLMPQNGFMEIWNDTSGMHWVDRILFVKHYFRVSYQVVLHRLNELNKTNNYNKIFNFQYKRKYNDNLSGNKEPFKLNWKFVENRYSRLVCQALIKEKISVSRAAEMLGVSISEMLDIINSTPREK